MTDMNRTFVPALGVKWLTPLYDIAARLTGERRFKRRLLEGAGIAPGHAVLDLGCGTGTLALMVKETYPDTLTTGVDIDPRILAIARRKAQRAAANIRLAEGSATALPFADASFDRVLTTLMLHHLNHDGKRQALAEAHRVLRPGGELHIADWGKPHNGWMRLAALGVRLLDGAETTADNLEGRLPALVAAAGFRSAAVTGNRMTPFGTLTFVKAGKES